MKKQICYILALTLLAALIALPVFALSGDDPTDYDPTASEVDVLTGFYNIETATNVAIQAASAGGVVEGQAMYVDIDDNSATGTGGYDEITMYPGSDRLRVSYSGASADKEYLVMLAIGNVLPETGSSIVGITQVSGAAFSNVLVFPTITADAPVLTLWITGENTSISVPLAYANGSEHYVKPSEGHTVSGTITCYGYTTVGAIVTVKSGSAVIASTSALGLNAEYSIDGLEPGEYTIEFTKKAHMTTSTSITITNSDEVIDKKLYLLGDLDGNGKVNALDRRLLVRYLAGWQGIAEQIISWDAADLDGNGKVNALDRRALVRYLAGWEDYKSIFEW